MAGGVWGVCVLIIKIKKKKAETKRESEREENKQNGYLMSSCCL